MCILCEIRQQMALAHTAGREAADHLTTAESELDRAGETLTQVGARDSENPHVKAVVAAVEVSRAAPARITDDVASGTRTAVGWAEGL